MNKEEILALVDPCNAPNSPELGRVFYGVEEWRENGKLKRKSHIGDEIRNVVLESKAYDLAFQCIRQIEQIEELKKKVNK